MKATTKDPIYLDHNATTPVDPEVLEAMLPFLRESFGNASSIHHFGQTAKKGVDQARAIVAGHLGCDEREVIFTSGATESDNHVLVGVLEALKRKGNHIVVSAIEHPAILETAKRLEKHGAEITRVLPDETGTVRPEAVEAALRDDTILVSIMAANNETGAIQPIAQIGKIVKARGIQFHTDAVQAAGKMSLKVDELGVDFMSLSGHKIYGPKGVGVLFIRRGSYIRPVSTGGHHEFNRRAGTENVPAIVGFGKAFDLAHQRMAEDNPRLEAMRDHLQARLLADIPNIYVTAREARRNPNTLHLLFHFVEGEGLLLKLSMFHGIGLSTGSACTSGTLEPSHVLNAMGISKQLGNSGARISLGRGNTMEQMDIVADALIKEVGGLRDMSPLQDAFSRGTLAEDDRRDYEIWMTPATKAQTATR
jgi:cysteine desulfurase